MFNRISEWHLIFFSCCRKCVLGGGGYLKREVNIVKTLFIPVGVIGIAYTFCATTVVTLHRV